MENQYHTRYDSKERLEPSIEEVLAQNGFEFIPMFPEKVTENDDEACVDLYKTLGLIRNLS